MENKKAQKWKYVRHGVYTKKRPSTKIQSRKKSPTPISTPKKRRTWKSYFNWNKTNKKKSAKITSNELIENKRKLKRVARPVERISRRSAVRRAFSYKRKQDEKNKKKQKDFDDAASRRQREFREKLSNDRYKTAREYSKTASYL
jgi:hypothetical protein